MSILLIQGPQGSCKSALANFIDEIAQEGRVPLLIVDPFEPEWLNLHEIILADRRGEHVVLVSHDDPRNNTSTEHRFNKVNEIMARATRITLTATRPL